MKKNERTYGSCNISFNLSSLISSNDFFGLITNTICVNIIIIINPIIFNANVPLNGPIIINGENVIYIIIVNIKYIKIIDTKIIPQIIVYNEKEFNRKN